MRMATAVGTAIVVPTVTVDYQGLDYDWLNMQSRIQERSQITWSNFAY